jgi:hypothetical protein
VKYTDLNGLLVRRLPELSDKYWELRKLWEGDEPGPHVVYGDLLAPYVVELLETSGDAGALERAFALMEELATAALGEIRDVVGASVLEAVIQNPVARERAWPLMGPVTGQMARRIAEAWLPE